METVAKIVIIGTIAYVAYQGGKIVGKVELAKDLYKSLVNDRGGQKV